MEALEFCCFSSRTASVSHYVVWILLRLSTHCSQSQSFLVHVASTLILVHSFYTGMYPKHAIKHVHGFNANSALGFISGTRKFSQSKLLLRFRQDQLSYYIRGNGMYSLRSLSSNATTSSTSGKGTRITTTGFLEDIKNLWKKSLQIPNSPKRDGWIIGQEDIFLHVPRVHVFYRLAWLLRWVMLGVM
jgi:hypothetical protein